METRQIDLTLENKTPKFTVDVLHTDSLRLNWHAGTCGTRLHSRDTHVAIRTLWSTGVLRERYRLELAPFVHYQTMGVFSTVARPAVNTLKYMVCGMN